MMKNEYFFHPDPLDTTEHRVGALNKNFHAMNRGKQEEEEKTLPHKIRYEKGTNQFCVG